MNINNIFHNIRDVLYQLDQAKEKGADLEEIERLENEYEELQDMLLDSNFDHQVDRAIDDWE